ncbi:MAG: hypothetical protein JNN15_15055 [Blastocatellia bacterium]|nr:hypothetical protein [Blastocatellia bacterium]
MIKIDAIVERLCSYTEKQAGIAVLAHTDAATADLFSAGSYYPGVLSGLKLQTDNVVHLSRRSATNYLMFDLLGPIAPDMLAEMGAQYYKLAQARFTSEEMLKVLQESSC